MNKQRLFMERWHKSSIIFKVFLTTSLLLILLSLFIYFSLYFFLPSFYENHKINQLESEIERLLEATADSSLSESMIMLDDFSHEQNVDILLLTQDGYLIQDFPIFTVSISEFFIGENNFIQHDETIYHFNLDQTELFDLMKRGAKILAGMLIIPTFLTIIL